MSGNCQMLTSALNKQTANENAGERLQLSKTMRAVINWMYIYEKANTPH